MKIDIVTLFPDMFCEFLSTSIVKRAIDFGKVKVQVHNFREFSLDKNKKVDDTPYGGGHGMVLMCQPIFDCVESLRTVDTKVVLLTPDGVTYNQQKAYQFAKEKHLILICGHYEGFDERIRILADYEISIGDYVLTGGELPSMVITDSIVRLLDGVIAEDSHIEDSFQNQLLDYPVYTKPIVFRGMKVPDILLSGHHANIKLWRHEEQVKRTRNRRPDLLERDE